MPNTTNSVDTAKADTNAHTKPIQRRSFLAGTPLALLASTMPSATLGHVAADHELIALCNRYFELDQYFAEAFPIEDIPDGDPGIAEPNFIIPRITALPAVSLEGARAKASVAVYYGDSEGVGKARLRDLTAGGMA